MPNILDTADPFYAPPWWLRNGLAMTLHTALVASRRWQDTVVLPSPDYTPHVFQGGNGVPIYGWVANPPGAIATIIGTYGITGDLDNQWFLQLLGRKAIARNFAVVLFDWRAHGKTAELSSTLTSDGIYEGPDFVCIAQQAKAMGCPMPCWFTGFSLGGQLALWGVRSADTRLIPGLNAADIGGAGVICPSLDSNRSLTYLERDPLGRHIEQKIAQTLKQLAWRLHELHPQQIDPDAIERANSIRGFDHELVIPTLGFDTVDAYYRASSPLPWLAELTKPTLILYAADDPLFDRAIIPELQTASATNPNITLWLTAHGGHVGYLSNRATQQHWGDRDPWWAWNRLLDWWEAHSSSITQSSNPSSEAVSWETL